MRPENQIRYGENKIPAKCYKCNYTVMVNAIDGQPCPKCPIGTLFLDYSKYVNKLEDVNVVASGTDTRFIK